MDQSPGIKISDDGCISAVLSSTPPSPTVPKLNGHRRVPSLTDKQVNSLAERHLEDENVKLKSENEKLVRYIQELKNKNTAVNNADVDPQLVAIKMCVEMIKQQYPEDIETLATYNQLLTTFQQMTDKEKKFIDAKKDGFEVILTPLEQEFFIHSLQTLTTCMLSLNKILKKYGLGHLELSWKNSTYKPVEEKMASTKWKTMGNAAMFFGSGILSAAGLIVTIAGGVLVYVVPVATLGATVYTAINTPTIVYKTLKTTVVLLVATGVIKDPPDWVKKLLEQQ
jgi:hypothetical protein